MMHGVETMVRTEVETMLLHGLPQAELEVGANGACGCAQGRGLGRRLVVAAEGKGERKACADQGVARQ